MHEGLAGNALVPATDAAKLAPDRFEPRLLLARIWLAMGRPDRAISDAQQVTTLSAGRLSPGDTILVHDVLARASLAVGNAAAAEESLLVLAAHPSQGAAGVRLAVLHVAQGRLADAREQLARGGARHPGHEEAFAKASAALASGAPGDVEVELALAELELDTNLLEEAHRRFQAVLTRDPSSDRAQEGMRQVATGGPLRAKRRAVRAPMPRSRVLAMRAFTVLLLVLGIGTIAFTRLRQVELEAIGRSPWPILAAGMSLMLCALLLAAVDLVNSRNFSPTASQTERS